MKKKLLILLLTAVTAFTVSCGSSETNAENKETTADEDVLTETGTDAETTAEVSETNDETTDSGFVYVFDNGMTVTLGGTLPELGEPINYAEAVSCIHPGMDKVYTFDGYSVTTSPDANGNDYVSEVALISDSVSFESGIKIGASKDTVISVLGENYTEQFGVMQYELGDTVISVVLDSDSNVLSFVAAMTK